MVVVVEPMIRATQADIEVTDEASVRGVKSPFETTTTGYPLESVQAKESCQLDQSDAVGNSPFAGKRIFPFLCAKISGGLSLLAFLGCIVSQHCDYIDRLLADMNLEEVEKIFKCSSGFYSPGF